MNRRIFCTSVGAAYTSALLHPVTSIAGTIVQPAGTGYVHHPDFSLFENNSAEHYLRTRWIDERLSVSGVERDTLSVTPIENPMEYIQEIHTGEHIALIDEYPASADSPLTIGLGARLAVAHILGAVDDVCSGRLRNAFCSIRPPGHHVQNNGEIGFCCYANVVLAARYARKKYSLGNILIIDWDYHQGNGTHGFICGDNETLFFETFNPRMYTTECDDFIPVRNGDDISKDALRINVQMLPESTNDDFLRTFEKYLVFAAEHFRPELVLVSSGFDCKKNDALGTFQVTANGISRLTRLVMQIADAYAGGKLVSMLEGGYRDLPRDTMIPGSGDTFSGLAQCAENHVKTLVTGDEQPETPFYSSAKTVSMIQPDHRPVIKWKNGKLSGLPRSGQPLRVTITDVNGRLVTVIRDVTRSWVEPAIDNLAKGSYTVTVCDRYGNILKVHGFIK